MDSASKFAGEYAGWQLISNDKLIKLEKTPVNAKTYMGITEFQSVDDYIFLCAMLIFLEDLEDNEAFLLSEMIGQIEMKNLILMRTCLTYDGREIFISTSPMKC